VCGPCWPARPAEEPIVKSCAAEPGGRRRSLRAAILAGAVLVVAAGCATPDPQNYFNPASDLAIQIRDLFAFIIWIAIGVFVVVEAALIWALIRFRARRGQGRPAQVHGNTPVEIAWTIAPAIILAIIAVPTITTIFRTYGPAPPNALQITIVGHQWWWEVRYPDQTIVTANEIHVPVGEPVNFTLQSADIIHSFWVPRLGGKRDVIPSRTNQLWFTVGEPGVYQGQCAEFCGIQHANMRLLVIAEPRESFDAWVRRQQAPPVMVAVGPAAEGRAVYARSACIGCHTIQGVSQGVAGPDLTHFGSRRTIAAATLENTSENLARWLRDPQGVKPGNRMPPLGLSEPQIQAVVAYLESLQ
jgi:cytochrome c oxidase subunit 2